jgi:hypothetical protein
MFTLCVFAPKAKAESAATAINGVYNGTYTCAIGPRTLKLSLLASGNGSLTGVFTFYLPPTSHAKAFSYTLNGTFDAASGKFKLNPVKWETPPPEGYSMVGMDGAFEPGTGQVVGRITYGTCGAFQATRDQSESANIASVMAPQKVGAAGSSAAVVKNPATHTASPPPPAPQSLPPATAVAAPPRHVGTYLIYCSSWTGPGVYVSDKFEVPPYGSGGKARLAGAFRQFLHEKYSLPIEDGSTPVGCGADMGVGGAERSIDAIEANVEANARQGKKIVKTGWKYVGTLPPPDHGP